MSDQPGAWSPPQASPEPEPPKTGELGAAAASRIVRAFSSPAPAFSELASSPTWLLALALIAALAFAGHFVITPRIDFEATLREAIADNPQAQARLPEDRIAETAAMQGKVARVWGYTIPVTVPVMMLVIAGVYFLGLKVVGSTAEFRPVFSGVVHATLPPSAVSGVLLSVVALQRDSFAAQDLESMLKSNLGAFLDPETPEFVMTLARTLDVFNVWLWVLLVIALAAVGRVSRGKAIGLVAVVWGLWAVGKAAIAVAF
jgi:hypothetical protein